MEDIYTGSIMMVTHNGRQVHRQYNDGNTQGKTGSIMMVTHNGRHIHRQYNDGNTQWKTGTQVV